MSLSKLDVWFAVPVLKDCTAFILLRVHDPEFPKQ
jgi:hypothetical protein